MVIDYIFTRDAKVGGLGGLNPPPPLILRIFFLIDHICYYVQVIFIGGGGVLAPLKLIQLYSICIFIYIVIIKSGLYIA